MLNLIAGIPLLWRAVSAAALASVLIGSCVVRDASMRKQGATRAVAKIERANDAAVKTTDAARSRSRDVRVRGQRDPYTVD